MRRIAGNSGVGFGAQRSLLVVVLFASLGLSCAGVPAEQDAVSRAALETEFAPWCEAMGLDCVGDSGAPVLDEPLTLEQWQALATVLHSLMTQSSEFSITSDDLAQEDFRQLVTLVGGAELFDHLVTAANEKGWMRLEKPAGENSLRSFAAAPISMSMPSGLLAEVGEELEIVIGPEPRIGVSGVALSSAAAPDPRAMTLVEMTGEDCGSMSIGDDVVHGVPLDFAFDSLLGEFGWVRETELNLELGTLLESLGPLLRWVTTPARHLSLDQEFFATAAQKLPLFVSREDGGNILYPFVQALQSVRTGSAEEGSLFTARFRPGSKLKCDVGTGPVSIEFVDNEIGVESIWQVDEDTVGIRFHGVKAKINILWGISLTPRAVEVSRDTIVVRDVPVVGTHTIRAEELRDLRCRHSL